MIHLLENKIAFVPLRPPDYIGSIYIPDQSLPRVNQGIAKYIGPQCTVIQEGDWCLFSGYSGSVTYIEGEGELIIMKEDFVLAVLEEEPIVLDNVFFKDKHGQFFEATYEELMNVVTRELRKRYRPIEFKEGIHSKPKIEEYDNVK